MLSTAARNEIDVRVCFCSVLDECWIGRHFTQQPEPIESCEVEAAQPQYR